MSDSSMVKRRGGFSVLLLLGTIWLAWGHLAPSSPRPILEGVDPATLAAFSPSKGAQLGHLTFVQQREVFVAEQSSSAQAKPVLYPSVKAYVDGSGAVREALLWTWIAVIPTDNTGAGGEGTVTGTPVTVTAVRSGDGAAYSALLARWCMVPPSTTVAATLCPDHEHYRNEEVALVVRAGVVVPGQDVVAAGGHGGTMHGGGAAAGNSSTVVNGKWSRWQWPDVLSLHDWVETEEEKGSLDEDEEHDSAVDTLTFEWEVYHECEYHSDFSMMDQTMPTAVVLGDSERDIVAALHNCAGTGTTLRVRGAGHSMNNQVNSDGTVLAIRHTPARYRLFADGRVEVTAGSQLLDIQQALMEHGRQIPVLPDYLHMTLGGYLSVGGYGVHSVVDGISADHVDSLRIILPRNGTAVWCSRKERPELFRFVVAGLGMFGIVEKAVVRTTPSYDRSVVITKTFSSISDLASSLAWLNTGSGLQSSHLTGFRGWVELHMDPIERTLYRIKADAVYSAGLRPEDDPIDVGSEFGKELRAAVGDSAVRTKKTYVTGEWQGIHKEIAEFVAHYPENTRLWGDYLFDFKGFIKFMAYLEETLFPKTAESGNAANLITVYVLAIRRGDAATQFPLEASSRNEAGGGTVYLVGLYFMPENDTGSVKEAVMLLHDAKTYALHQCAGRPYMYSWQDISAEECASVYGSDSLRAAMDLRRDVDPYHTIGEPPHMSRCFIEH